MIVANFSYDMVSHLRSPYRWARVQFYGDLILYLMNLMTVGGQYKQ